MPANRPTAKRQRIDDGTWEIFVQACGGRCCACSSTGPLQQGHIHRHADGGRLIFENLVPLCKSCNGKYNNGFTPDTRPAGWRDAFWKLLLAENEVTLRWQHPQQGGNTLPATETAQNNGLIDLTTVEFRPLLRYTTPTPGAPSSNTPKPMLPHIAEQLMWDLVDKGKEAEIRPKPPLQKRQDQMKQAAIRVGAEAFRIAGEEFLQTEPEPWVVGTKDRAYAHADSWQHFCDCFAMYLAEGRKRAVRLAEQARLQRERDLVRQREAAEAKREHRWKDYLLAANVPSYPGIPAADLEHITTVLADKDGGIRDVSEERLERSLDVYRHWKLFVTDELLQEKNKLRGLLRECVTWAKRYSIEDQRDYAQTFRALSDWLDRAKSIEEVRDNKWEIEQQHFDLDPSRPKPNFDDPDEPF